MPTPFMHLQFAGQIRSDLAHNPRRDGRLLSKLDDAWPAFYFGNVAPDVQTINGMPREQTHFYGLPPEPDNFGYTRMLFQYPRLAHPAQLTQDQAVFIAAYAAHLVLDLIWFRKILVPYFYHAPGLGDMAQRHLLHLILLSYLDKLSLEALPAAAAEPLTAAQPENWLPFVTDEDLLKWRDFLVPQLLPGAMPETINIYAGRLQMTAEAFAAKLDDPIWMNEHLFAGVPIAAIQQQLAAAVADSIQVIDAYLGCEL